MSSKELDALVKKLKGEQEEKKKQKENKKNEEETQKPKTSKEEKEMEEEKTQEEKPTQAQDSALTPEDEEILLLRDNGLFRRELLVRLSDLNKNVETLAIMISALIDK